jgi:hypothetical protein
LLIKGPGSFKKGKKFDRMVEYLKAYQLKPLMTLLFNSWTTPLNTDTVICKVKERKMKQEIALRVKSQLFS